MKEKDDILYFKIGSREVYFFRDSEYKRNCFGFRQGDKYLRPVYLNDVDSTDPKQYLVSFLSLLEHQSNIIEEGTL